MVLDPKRTGSFTVMLLQKYNKFKECKAGYSPQILGFPAEREPLCEKRGDIFEG